MTDKMTFKPLICCLCLQPIPAKGTWIGGNSADPVVEGGRCCDACDARIVLPARLRRMYGRPA